MYPDWGLNWGTTVPIPEPLAFFFMEIEWTEQDKL